MQPIVIHFGTKTAVFYVNQYLAIYDPESKQDMFDCKMDVYEGSTFLGCAESDRETTAQQAVNSLIEKDLPTLLRPPDEPNYSLERPQTRENRLRPAILPEALE